jgi:CHAT domain-containing protein
VVLSACASALGEERGGEGLIGLTRAFQYAGARAVAATLWNVDDRATARLMTLFYRRLRAGAAKDEALRAAQVELRSDPEVEASAPYYWAAFQIFGDGR